jgi:hypothetical protein
MLKLLNRSDLIELQERMHNCARIHDYSGILMLSDLDY